MKLHERVAMVAESYPVGKSVTLEELKGFKLGKDICKLVEKNVFRKVAPGLYTLTENYEENSKKRKPRQVLEDKLDIMFAQKNVNDVLTTKELRAFGFDSHMILKLVEDGYLSSENYGEYKLLRDSVVVVEKQEEVIQDKYAGLGHKEEKLNNLCEGVLEEKTLTTSELRSYGFTPNDLTLLVKIGTLKRVQMGLYEFSDADLIYDYRLKASGPAGGKCVDIAYKLDPTHIGANLTLLRRNVRNDNLNEACKYLEFLYFNNEGAKKINSLCIYLLNMTITLPASLKVIANSLTFEDIDIAPDNENLSGVIKKIYNKKFFNLINDIDLYMEDSVGKELVLTFVRKAGQKNVDYNEMFRKFVRANDWESLKVLIEEKATKSVVDNYALKLVKIIEQVRDTLVVPNKRMIPSRNTFSLIDFGNYEGALKATIEFNNKKKMSLKGNYLYLLLAKLVNMIKVVNYIKKVDYVQLEEFLKQDRIDIEYKDLLLEVCEAILALRRGESVEVKEHGESLEETIKAWDLKFAKNLLDNDKSLGNNFLRGIIDDYFRLEIDIQRQNNATGFDRIYNLLNNGNTNGAFMYIHEYLESLNLVKYETLIISLVKLSLAEKDFTFVRVFLVLTYLKRGSYVPDYNLYVSYFYQAIREKNLEEARGYFDIIEYFKDSGELNIDMANMRRLLVDLMMNNAKGR